MRVLITTLYDAKMSAVGAICAKSLRRFFGDNPLYGVRIFEDLIDPGFAPPWNKLLAVRSVLHEAEWVLWVDADCIFHREANLCDYIETKADFRPAQDYNGINTGVFLLRNCPWSLAFLNTLLFVGDVSHDEVFAATRLEVGVNAVKSLHQSFTSISARTDPLPRNVISDTNTGFRPDSLFVSTPLP